MTIDFVARQAASRASDDAFYADLASSRRALEQERHSLRLTAAREAQRRAARRADSRRIAAIVSVIFE